MGYPKGVEAFAAGCRGMDLQRFARFDEFFELYPAQTLYIKILVCRLRDNICNHVQLGDTWQYGIARKMTGEPWRTVTDHNPGQYFIVCNRVQSE